MSPNGFFGRLKDSADRVILGYDLLFSAIVVIAVFLFLGREIVGYDIASLVRGGTSFSAAMVAVILTGISILITMADSRAAKVLKGNNSYSSFLFTFEFTAILALVTAVIGIIVQALQNPYPLVYIFIFSLIYTVTAVTTTISRTVTYGDKLATMETLEELPEDISVKVVDEAEAKEEME